MFRRFRGRRHFRAHETARMDELDGLPLASCRRRALALAIDLGCVVIVRLLLLLAGWIVFRHHPVVWSKTETETVAGLLKEGVHKLEELVESVLYFAVALKLGRGQTIGKAVMKIRVMSLTHREVGWWQSIERALGYGASLLEGGFGFFQYYLNRNRQCVHDRIAETIVVDTRSKHRLAVVPEVELDMEDPELKPGPSMPIL